MLFGSKERLLFVNKLFVYLEKLVVVVLEVFFLFFYLKVGLGLKEYRVEYILSF